MLMNNLRNFPPVTLGIFQSTLLQEERLKLKYIQNGNSYFNPRSYKRSDIVGICLCVGYVVFQSTLLQEERQVAIFDKEMDEYISIHAPTRGATPPLNIDDKCKDISIHAPTRGATLVELEKTMNEIISIHAPTRGATLCGNRISRLLLFQSTLLQEERRIT